MKLSFIFGSYTQNQDLSSRLECTLHTREWVYGPFTRKNFQMFSSYSPLLFVDSIPAGTCRVYLVTTALVRTFHSTLLETDDSDVAFVSDFQVTLLKLDSKSVRVAATSR